MAVGTLSPDEARFVQQVSTSTGLDPNVVTAWVGSESGWGVYKPTHNYLNVGPGEQFSSVDAAAGRVAGLINTSPTYSGIRSAIPSGAGAQISAIGSSAWGTVTSTLDAVFSELTGIKTVKNYSIPIPGVPDISVPSAGDVAGALAAPFSAAVSQAGEIAVGLIFAAAAVGLIGLGVAKLTAKPAHETVAVVQDHVGKIQTAAQLAAI